MRTLITIGVAMGAACAMAAPSAIESQVIQGQKVISISSNGKWMVCELDADYSLGITNLETGQNWKYVFDGSDFGTNYPKALGPKCVSDDGTVVAEVADVPSYWKNGVWTNLKGFKRNSNGVVTAVVGGITPDGSVIAGSLGKGSSVWDDNPGVGTVPCVWYRQDDGTYGDPVWLPVPRDFFGGNAQYINCTDISADGKTISASMTCGNGFWHVPFSFTQNEDGSWNALQLGYELINPTGLEIMRSPGDYHGPNPPNYEEYMTPEKLYEFYYVAGPAWIDDLYAQGITDETEIALLELQFAEEFMEGEALAAYDVKLQAFLNAYVPWWESYEKYIEFLEKLGDSGVDFTMNNAMVSPDGQYIITSATGRGTYPVRFDARTGEYTQYRGTTLYPSCVTDNNDILCWAPGNDADWPMPAYIIPEGETRAMTIHEYWKKLGMEDNYDWMWENLYQSVVVSINASGQEVYEDRWSAGKPICNPDMTLMGFGTSTFYWEAKPGNSDGYYTFLLNTGIDPDSPASSGIDCLPAPEEAVDDESNAVYYNLQGVRVDNPDRGLYIRVANGRSSKILK